MVNSWHHQGLKIIPNNLRVIARSFDRLDEAVVIDIFIHL
ncbi:MAG: gamma-glutamyl-gamma-aminobutyrate hydrolase family protein [Flavobacteriales bacterium]